jgi:hypothetical protein
MTGVLERALPFFVCARAIPVRAPTDASRYVTRTRAAKSVGPVFILYSWNCVFSSTAFRSTHSSLLPSHAGTGRHSGDRRGRTPMKAEDPPPLCNQGRRFSWRSRACWLNIVLVSRSLREARAKTLLAAASFRCGSRVRRTHSRTRHRRGAPNICLESQ